MRLVPKCVALLVAVVSVPLVHAAECKYDRNEIDSFTSDWLVHTQKRMLTDRVNGFVGRVFGGSASEVLVRGVREGGLDYIALEIRLLKTYSSSPDTQDLREALSVGKGAKLMILMDDKSVVRLEAARDFRGKASYNVDSDGNYGVDARISILYNLDESNVESLTNNEAAVIRVAVDSGRLGLVGREGNINFGTNNKSKHFFRDAVTCLQQAAPAERPQ